MTRFVRRLVLIGAVVSGLVLAGSATLTAQGAGAAPVASPAPTVGGVSLRYLPPGLGFTTDFTYDYDDVDFASRTWESRTPDGGYRVDLDVTVMRGARLTSGEALRRWFVGYEQRDPQPTYEPVSVHGARGYLCRDEIVWLVRPGLAIAAQVDGSRFGTAQLVRLARAARPPIS